MYSLIIFLLATAVNLAGLSVDWFLAVNGATTITMMVKEYPWLGIPILAWQFLFPVALAVHFYLE